MNGEPKRLDRVLVLMPTTRDAVRTVALLGDARIGAVVCDELADVCRGVRSGVDAVLLTDDAILSDTSGQLAESFRTQPEWSAIPVIAIVREGATRHVQEAAPEALKGLIVIERPVRIRSLITVVRSALRGRRHQYQVRDAIRQRDEQAAALRAHDERLRFALDAGKLGSWSLDLSTRAFEGSALFKAIFGLSSDATFTFTTLKDAIHEADREAFDEAVERSMSEGIEFDGEFRIRWPNSEVRWVMVGGQTVRADERAASHVVGIALDITSGKRLMEELERSRFELARKAEQLKRTDRRKDEFLATLAHELRNPLAPIRTGVDLLTTANDPDVMRRTLGVMQRQVAHMVRLIDDLLDVSRITRGKLALQRKRVPLSTIVDAAIEASKPFISRRKHSLNVHLEGEPIWLDGDPTRLAQVISNLLNNSSKYTPPGGQIDLSARRDGTGATVEVRDNGVGIPPDKLQSVFEMFNQVNSDVVRSEGGLGIGLALVRSLVELHGGSVTAMSAGPGRGTIMSVWLPASVVEAPASEKLLVATPTSPSKKRRVLVVDDNHDAADLLTVMLERAGYTTTTAYDSESGIAAAEACDPHIVILDIGLPGANGYDVARHLRKCERNGPLGLIALTGWGTQEDKQKAMAAGFDIHLTKPIDSDRLKAALATFDVPASE